MTVLDSTPVCAQGRQLQQLWSQVLLQHDSARPHTSLCTREAVATIVWTVLPYPPYNPDIAPSDFHLLGRLKDAL